MKSNVIFLDNSETLHIFQLTNPMCVQVRGEAGPRQVAGAQLGLQHNLGLGGACVVALYKKANLGQAKLWTNPALFFLFIYIIS